MQDLAQGASSGPKGSLYLRAGADKLIVVSVEWTRHRLILECAALCCSRTAPESHRLL